MKALIDRLFRAADNMIIRVAGVLGGIVCAVVACMLAIHLWPYTGYSTVILFLACALLLVGFSAEGLLIPRYFSRFSASLLTGFCDETPNNCRDEDGIRLVEFFAMASVFLALIAMAIGVLFRTHALVALGLSLFTFGALKAPGMK